MSPNSVTERHPTPAINAGIVPVPALAASRRRDESVALEYGSLVVAVDVAIVGGG